MSVVIVSDLHAHNHPRFAVTEPDGSNSRFADLLRVLAQVRVVVEKEQPDTLVILGDLTHRRNFVQFTIYTALMQWVADVRDAFDLDVIVVVGNHDRETHGSHSLGPFKFMPRVTVVDEPMVLPVLGTCGLFVPYTDGEAIITACQGQEGGPAEYAFAHYALDGKILGTEYEYALPSALGYRDVQHFKRMFFGHVHAPGIERDGQIVYVGAPLHFDFGDVGPRYCWTLSDDGSIKAHVLVAPQFLTTTYPKIPVCGLPGKGYLRVLNTPVDKIREAQDFALESGWLGCSAMADHVVPNEIKSLSVQLEGDEALIRSFVSDRYTELNDGARARLVAAGLRYYKETDGG